MNSQYLIMPIRHLDLSTQANAVAKMNQLIQADSAPKFYSSVQQLRHDLLYPEAPKLEGVIGPSAAPDSIFSHGAYYANFNPKHFALLKVLAEDKQVKSVVAIVKDVTAFIREPGEQAFKPCEFSFHKAETGFWNHIMAKLHTPDANSTTQPKR